MYYSNSEIDYFYTCLNDKSYLIPVDEAGKSESCLRFLSKNPKNPNIHWARDYELDVMLMKITRAKD